MASLGTLVPTSFSSESGTTWTTTTVGNIDNTVAGADGAFIVSGANATGNIFYEFTNMPSDFLDIDTLSYDIRYKIDSLSGDTEVLSIQIFASDGTTAYTNASQVTVRTSSVGLTNKGSTAFTVTATGLAASKADWDSALIRISTSHSANMGADGSVWSIDEVELTGTYTSQGPPTIALNTADAHDFGSDTTPTLEATATDPEGNDVRYNVQIGADSAFGVASYYFNASDAGPTDPNGVWSNDANLFDSDEATGALISTSGSTSSNYLQGDGTSAPTSGNTITQVRARVRGSMGATATANASIYSDGLAELLGTPTVTGTGEQWGSYVTLSVPSGGWTWQKVSDLEVKVYATGSPSFAAVAKVEIEVTSSPLLDKTSGTDSGFANTVTGGDTDPFNSGEKVSFTVQAGDALAGGTYYWRARAIDPNGSNTYSSWATARSFTISTGGDLSVNKSDSVTVSESVKVQLVSFVNVSDSITVTESLSVILVSLIAVSDSISVSEALSVLLVSLVGVSDSITVSESVSVLLPWLNVDVSDSISVSESIQLNLISFVSVSDSVSVAENVKLELVSLPSVSDNVSVAESLTTLLTSFVSVSDAVAVAEALQMNLVSLITVSDSVSVAESTQVMLLPLVTVSDSIGVAESVTVEVPYLGPITVSDSVAVTEAITLLLLSFVAVSDSIAVAENTIVEFGTTGDLAVNVSDGISVTEALSVVLSDPQINVNNSITVSENLALFLTIALAGSDSVSVSESLLALLVSFVSVSDSVSVGESVNVALVHTLSVSDSITVVDIAQYYQDTIVVAERVQVELQGADNNLTISVSDSISVAESVNVFIPFLTLSVSDAVSVSEAVTLLLTSFIAVSESISVSEALVLNLICFIAVSDAVSIAESVTLDETISVAVSDSVSVAEAVTLLIPTLHISVSDSITVSEALSIGGSFWEVTTSDSVTVSESVTVSFQHEASTSDSIVLTENVALNLVSHATSSDSVSVSESIKLLIIHQPAVSESIVLTESVSLLLPQLYLSASEEIAVSESVFGDVEWVPGWADVPTDNQTWSNSSADDRTWTDTTTASEEWSDSSADDRIWTDVTTDDETWTD